MIDLLMIIMCSKPGNWLWIGEAVGPEGIHCARSADKGKEAVRQSNE